MATRGGGVRDGGLTPAVVSPHARNAGEKKWRSAVKATALGVLGSVRRYLILILDYRY